MIDQNLYGNVAKMCQMFSNPAPKLASLKNCLLLAHTWTNWSFSIPVLLPIHFSVEAGRWAMTQDNMKFMKRGNRVNLYAATDLLWKCWRCELCSVFGQVEQKAHRGDWDVPRSNVLHWCWKEHDSSISSPFASVHCWVIRCINF